MHTQPSVCVAATAVLMRVRGRGQVVIPTPSKVLGAEEVVDRWYDLTAREGKAKDKDNVAGKVRALSPPRSAW